MTEKSVPIKILHLEDNESDALLIQMYLKKEDLNYTYLFADNELDFRAHLNNEEIDIVLSDYNLPDYSGADALKLIMSDYPHIPFVFVSGTMGEEAAIESLLNGATDYILKNRPGRLGAAIRRALDETRLRKNYQKTSDTLKQKEEQYKTLVEGMNEGLMLTDNNDIILFVNQQTCQISGFSETELIGQPCHEILFDDFNSRIILEKSKLLQKGIKNTFEVKLLKKNKQSIWLRISESPDFNERGSVTGSIRVFEDISDRKNAEDELRKLTRAVVQSPDSIVITDTNGIIEFANPKTVDLTGYAIEELIGNKTSIFSSGKESIVDYEHLWKTIRSGIIWEGEFHNQKKNGELYWESATISPIYNAKNEITHFLAIKEDVTERKKLNQELLLAKEHAEESDRLKSAFLANISHEIRTPMNGILGFAELLKNPKLAPDVQGKYIKVIEQSGNRMLNIINDIIDISKIEAGQMILHIERTNVNQLLRDLHIFFAPEARSRGLKLTFSSDLPDEISIIHTDHTKLAQIFTNLIKNALKFTKTGTIDFGYYCKFPSRHPIVLNCFVRDTGVGIPADQSAMIFERFRQGSVSLTRAYEGAGLGLSISKAFIEMMGGKMELESEVGKGSLFSFVLPCLQKKIITSDIAEPQNKAGSESICILLAEDDDTSRLYMNVILENENIVLIEVINGLEAVETVKHRPEIQLVLMDIKMPIMDGYEAMREIKKIRPELPIVAQTAYAFREEKQKATNAGCDEYLSKPINKQELLKIIRKYRPQDVNPETNT